MSRWLVCCIIMLVPMSVWSGPIAPDILNQLQQGGYVFVFRHGITDSTQKDTDLSDLANCDAQRLLNVQGIEQSKLIGSAMRDLDIPIGDVFSSQFCRCLDTAKLAFGKVTPVLELTSIQGASMSEKQRRIFAIRKVVAQGPATGVNIAIISHKFLINWSTGVWLEEGEAAIFRPNGNGFELVAKVQSDDWAATANP